MMAALLASTTMTAQMAEEGPFAPNNNQGNQRALFDLLFNIDIGGTGTVGVDGLAGVAYVNGQYWVSEWASDVIHILDGTGALVETTAVAGVTGTRSITSDGTFVYMGGGSLSIYKVDPVTRIIDSVIAVTTTSSAEARMCTYDETLDGGNGGFWIGDFSSDIASVDMNGNELSVIPLTTHGTVIYGGAVDNVSPGGPFLWIHDQAGTAPERGFITQLDATTGAPTGVQYNYITDALGTEVLAGGLFISDEVGAPGVTALVGLCQCTPSNELFALELVEDLGVTDNALANLSIFPNPATGGTVSIETALPGEKQVAVYDVLGKQLINTTVTNELNVDALSAGVYVVQVSQNGATASKKLVIK